jgi:hypothetical protein
MPSIPVDQARMTARMISAGTTVEKITEFDRTPGAAPVAAKDRPQSIDKETGARLWRGYVFVPGEDGNRPEQIAVKLAMPVEPVMPPFGVEVEFENLAATPYADTAGRVQISYRATGIFPAAIARTSEKAA